MNVVETSAVTKVAAVPSSVAASQVAKGSNATHLAANILGAFLILGLGVAGLMFFGRKPEVPTETSKQDSANVAPLVDVAVVKPWDQPFHLDIDGEVSTCKNVFDVSDDSRPGKWELQLREKKNAVALGVPLEGIARTVRASLRSMSC